MKQKRPPSLRLRLIAAFVFLGVALGPLVSGAMLWVSYTLEEEAVKATVQERLQHLLSTPEHYVLREHPRHPNVYVLSRSNSRACRIAFFPAPTESMNSNWGTGPGSSGWRASATGGVTPCSRTSPASNGANG